MYNWMNQQSESLSGKLETEIHLNCGLFFKLGCESAYSHGKGKYKAHLK